MDFGDILSEWDRQTSKPYGKKRIGPRPESSLSSGSAASDDFQKQAHPVDVWIRRHGLVDKDEETESGRIDPAALRRELHALKPQAVIDLHGCTRDEVFPRLDAFFRGALAKGLKKILIVHGKGTHSEGSPVLLREVRLFLEKESHAGESGFSDKTLGGNGSTWVLLK